MEIIYEDNRELTEEKNVNKKSGGKLGKKLLVSLMILLFAAAIKLYMPESFMKISEDMSKSVDFVSAFNAVEAGISGEVEMSDAVKEACRYAFVGTDADDIMVFNLGEYIEKYQN